MKTFDELYQVLSVFDRFQIEPVILARDYDITVAINCSDFFDWGSGDLEYVTPEDIPLLEKTFDDLSKVRDGFQWLYTDDLFVCRKRKLRPMDAVFDHLHEEVHALFLGAGPWREMDFCNHPSTKYGDKIRNAKSI